MFVIDRGNFHMEDNDLKLSDILIWLISQNLPNLTYTDLSTLLLVWHFEVVHILKAHKISDISRPSLQNILCNNSCINTDFWNSWNDFRTVYVT